jgi:hypothetical protein
MMETAGTTHQERLSPTLSRQSGFLILSANIVKLCLFINHNRNETVNNLEYRMGDFTLY